MTENISDDNPLLRNIPLGRMGTTGDVAALAVFLSGESAGYITGKSSASTADWQFERWVKVVMIRKVVVTGLGAVTPLGNDVPTFWNNLLQGICGIAPITHFDASEYKATLAAEVKDLDMSIYMEKSEIRKSDLFSQYAMAAACQAVSDSGIIGTISP